MYFIKEYKMDIYRALHGYIERIVTETDGMKVLLVDSDTVPHLKMMLIDVIYTTCTHVYVV